MKPGFIKPNKNEIFTKGVIAQLIEPLMTDERSIAAVKAAIEYGKGMISNRDLFEASEAAMSASVFSPKANEAAESEYSKIAANSYAAQAAYLAAAFYEPVSEVIRIAAEAYAFDFAKDWQPGTLMYREFRKEAIKEFESKANALVEKYI